MFDFLKKKPKANKIEESLRDFDTVWNMKDVNTIWKIEDNNNLIVALYGYLSEKCKYGSQLEKLTEPEKIMFLCQELEGEINNGGFSQFFYNSSGEFAKETLSALKDIGAMKTFKLLSKAISLFPNSYVPKDREERENLLDDVNEEILEELDNEFYEYEDNLLELNYSFIMEHKNAFM